MSNQLRYRRDIDGLRAIAILAVLVFHAYPPIMPGGFVGVDVFFVISGFLISSIIFRQLEGERFSLRHFYSRRIRRIYPALMLLMAANLLFGWFVLLPDEFQMLGKHVAGGNGFISNLVLWSEAGYFDSASETKTLLHLWSLGIEEQFYIIWPLSLWLVWKKKYSFLTLTVVFAGLSFMSNLFSMEKFSASANYYLPTNRFWELMVGGFWAYVVMHKPNWQPSGKGLTNTLSVLGLLAVVISARSLGESNSFPGWWALLPTLGALFIVASPGAWFNRNILGNRVMVYIGLISYPWYLWHWSILSFLHILGFTDPLHMTLGLVLSLLLSVLTYEGVEKAAKKNTGKILIPGLVAISVLLIGVGLSVHGGQVQPRNNSPAIQQAMHAIGDWEYPEGLTQDEYQGIKVYKAEGGLPGKVLFLGDSHIRQYSPRIVRLIKEETTLTKSVVFLTEGGCPPIPQVYEDRHPRCNAELRQASLDLALSPEIDTVVIGASWNWLARGVVRPQGTYRYYYQQDDRRVYFDQGGKELALQELEKFLVQLANHKKVFLVIDNPSGAFFNPLSHFTGNRLVGFTATDSRFQEMDAEQAHLRELMIEIAHRAGVEVIDPVAVICDSGKCPTTMPDGTPIYKDNSHLRPFFVREYLEILDVTVQ